MRRRKKINWKVLIASLIIVFIFAGIGNFLTEKNTGSIWYSIKPAITVPNWVFPIVWNVIFVLIAYSLYFAWIKADKNKRKKETIIILFGINFILNILWIFLFFVLQNPFYAIVEIFFLWLSIFVLIFEMWEIDKKSGLMLVPYLIWTSFAIYLNWMSYLNTGLF